MEQKNRFAFTTPYQPVDILARLPRELSIYACEHRLRNGLLFEETEDGFRIVLGLILFAIPLLIVILILGSSTLIRKSRGIPPQPTKEEILTGFMTTRMGCAQTFPLH